MDLAQYLPVQVYVVLMVVSRVGSAMILLPGIGETFIPVRVRLLLAMLIAIVAAPVVRDSLPPEPPTAFGLFALIVGEVIIGLYFGLVARMLLLTLDTAGRIISFSVGLAAAQIFNPSISDQGSLLGLLFTTLAIVVMFASDVHHLMIRGVIDSYSLFGAGTAIPIADMSRAITEVVGVSFKVAVQFSAPFMVLSLLFFVSLGVLSRLMPQLQIFFIGLPVQILVGLSIVSLILGALMSLFLEYYVDTAARYLTAS